MVKKMVYFVKTIGDVLMCRIFFDAINPMEGA